jgi:hypothetical protein
MENFKRKLVSFAQHNNRSVMRWPVFPTCNSHVYYLDLHHTITPYLENKHTTKPAGRYILTVNNEGSPTFWSDGHRGLFPKGYRDYKSDFKPASLVGYSKVSANTQYTKQATSPTRFFQIFILRDVMNKTPVRVQWLLSAQERFTLCMLPNKWLACGGVLEVF